VRPARLRPEMLRKFTMGLVVRQGRMGGHRPLRQAARRGEHDVQPALFVSIAQLAAMVVRIEQCGVAA
jgi:hypothetical protein